MALGFSIGADTRKFMLKCKSEADKTLNSYRKRLCETFVLRDNFMLMFNYKKKKKENILEPFFKN